VYLAEHAGIETAERFLSSVEDSFTDLARNPGIGTALSLQDPRLTGLRKWRVNGFEKFLIFYLPRPGGVSIVRVLHAAQDWWRISESVMHFLHRYPYQRNPVRDIPGESDRAGGRPISNRTAPNSPLRRMRKTILV
jgi:toxin ParE1/3/4